MRNFYTALDYDSNLIMLGVNSKTTETGEVEMAGKTPLHPYGSTTIPRKTKSGVPTGIFIFILTVMLLAACGYFIFESRKINK